MSYRSKLLIQKLVEGRRQESIRIHDQFVNALAVRTHNGNEKDIIRTILSDLPQDDQITPHNHD